MFGSSYNTRHTLINPLILFDSACQTNFLGQQAASVLHVFYIVEHVFGSSYNTRHTLISPLILFDSACQTLIFLDNQLHLFCTFFYIVEHLFGLLLLIPGLFAMKLDSDRLCGAGGNCNLALLIHVLLLVYFA